MFFLNHNLILCIFFVKVNKGGLYNRRVPKIYFDVDIVATIISIETMGNYPNFLGFLFLPGLLPSS